MPAFKTNMRPHQVKVKVALTQGQGILKSGLRFLKNSILMWRRTGKRYEK